MTSMAERMKDAGIDKSQFPEIKGDLVQRLSAVLEKVDFDFKTKNDLFENLMFKIVSLNNISRGSTINHLICLLRHLNFNLKEGSEVKNFASLVRKEFDKIEASLSFFYQETGFQVLVVDQKEENIYDRFFYLQWPQALKVNTFARFLLTLKCLQAYQDDKAVDFFSIYKELKTRQQKKKIIAQKVDKEYLDQLTTKKQKLLYVFHFFSISQFSKFSIQQIIKFSDSYGLIVHRTTVNEVLRALCDKLPDNFKREKKNAASPVFYKCVKAISFEKVLKVFEVSRLTKQRSSNGRIDLEKACEVFLTLALSEQGVSFGIFKAKVLSNYSIQEKSASVYFSLIVRALSSWQETKRSPLLREKESSTVVKTYALHSEEPFDSSDLFKIVTDYKKQLQRDKQAGRKQSVEKVNVQEDLTGNGDIQLPDKGAAVNSLLSSGNFESIVLREDPINLELAGGRVSLSGDARVGISMPLVREETDSVLKSIAMSSVVLQTVEGSVKFISGDAEFSVEMLPSGGVEIKFSNKIKRDDSD